MMKKASILMLAGMMVSVTSINQLNAQTAKDSMQVFPGWLFAPERWQYEPMFEIKSQEVPDDLLFESANFIIKEICNECLKFAT
jgi:hypothetical protein